MQKTSIKFSRHLGKKGARAAWSLTLLILTSACQSPEPVVSAPEGLCGNDGFLTTELFGAIQVSLNWQTDVLACEGMPRPNGEGARLHFSGPAQAGSAKRSLAFILGIPDLKQGKTAQELPSNVTMIEEGSSRFFATQNTQNCWTDVHQHELLPDDKNTRYRISGILYCLAPLAELNGDANISFTEMTFTGRLDWQIPQ